MPPYKTFSSTRVLTRTALLSTSAMLTATPAALAQGQAGASLEEVLVTATRRSASVQDIPYNISAVSGATIDAAGMLDAAELLRSIPGIAAPDRGPRNAATLNSIRIRGLNVDGAARGDYAASAAPTAATYINDTPIFANMLLKDLERVEVLRGPQGTLYGSGALGGAVRYITQKPNLDEFSGQVRGSTSNTDGSGGVNWTGDLILNIPVSSKFALRAAISHIDYAGVIDYTNIYKLDANQAPVAPADVTDPSATYQRKKDADTATIDFLRLSALWQLSDAVAVNFLYSRQEDETGSRRASSAGYSDGFGNVYGEYESGSVQLEPSEADMELFATEVNVDLGFATLTSSTSMYEVNGSAISENTGFYAQKGWLANFYYNSPRPLARADRRFGDEAFVQEFRLVSQSDGPWDWVLGAYYQDQDKRIGQTSTLAGYGAWASTVFGWMSEGYGYDANDNDFIFDDLTNVKETAVFGEVTYDLTEQLHVTAGVRWFDSKVESSASVDLPFWNVLFPPAVSESSSGKKDTLFKLNASYDISDSTMLYSTVSEGYRRGGAASVPTTGFFAEDPAWLSYESDSVINYEVGVKGQTDTLRYTVSLFQVDWEDPQINTATANWGFFTAANGDEARTKGIEAELEGQLSNNLRVNLGYTYVDAKLTGDFLSPTGSLIAESGNRMPAVPEHTFNAALTYLTTVSGIATSLRLDGYMQSSSENYIDNDHPVYGREHSGFGIWNANANFNFDAYQLSIFVKNIANDEGITADFSESYMGTDPAQNYAGSGAKREITLPRTAGISLTWDF